jgi:uncharacterized membrane protein YeiH
MSALLGMLTGIGGGITRDVLLAEVPQVLRSDLYAVAALVGAPVVVIAIGLALPMAFRCRPAGPCASVFASWRSDMVGICLLRICPRKGERE